MTAPALVTPPHSPQFTPPPKALVAAVQRATTPTLLTLAPDEKAALLLVGHIKNGQQQFNAVFAWRAPKGFQLDTYVAKDWGERIGGGVRVVKTWK